jgi:hypothetical protein
MSGKQDKRRRRGGSAHADTEAAYQARVRQVLGGQLPPSGDPGLRALFRCPTCGHPWLAEPSAPHGSRLMLGGDELAALARELGADLATLPSATCRSCAALHASGEVTIDEYGRGAGYAISWEGVEPAGAHVLASCQSVRWLHSPQGQDARAGGVTEFARARRLLRWLETLPMPRSYMALDAAGSEAMAIANPPGHGAPGTEHWVWRGGMWQAPCPVWEGEAVVMLAQAMPPDQPYSLPASVTTVRRLARHLSAGGLPGEDSRTSSDEDV